MRKHYLFSSAQSCNPESSASTFELGGAFIAGGGGGKGGIGRELAGSLDTF